MKKQNIILTTIVSLFTLSCLTSCNKDGGNHTPEPGTIFYGDNLVNFTEGTPSSRVFSMSDGYSNGSPFGCEWSKDNISFNEDGMTLSITHENEIYKGAEIRTITGQGSFTEGYFGATLKPSNVVGTVSTFFLYTGPSEGNPHDEIDIEFLGKETTKVQFNYYGGSDKSHEYMYDLGFDASEEYHQYGFYWDLEKIIWFVDNVPVYQVTSDIPTHAMKLFENFWCGDSKNAGIMSWCGHINDNNLPATCTYKELTYADRNGNGIIIPISDDIELEENKISLKEKGFSSNTYYTVSKNNEDYDVSFTQEEGTYHALSPNAFADIKFGEPKYVVTKLQNLSSAGYVVNLQYDNRSGAHLCVSGLVLESANGSSSYTRTGSTCSYFFLGANDTATFKVNLSEPTEKFGKIDLIASGGSQATGSFKIIDWFVYDKNPQDQSGGGEITKLNLMDNGFTSNSYYVVSSQDGAWKVDFDISGIHGLELNNVASVTPTNPDYARIKVTNNSSVSYQLAVSFINNSANACSSGSLISSANGSSSYARHGSTVEYFNLGANDTAEFSLSFLSAISSFSKIELIASPGSALQGSFTIVDFYIAQ